MDLVRKMYAVPQARVLNEKRREIEHLISTPDVDRDGEVLLPRGCKSETYLQNNPVVFFNHRAMEHPIGRCLGLTCSDKGVQAVTQFAGLEQLHPDAERTFRLYRDGFMRSWSVGFVPQETNPAPVRTGQRGRTIEGWEMMEYSAVGIPSNPHAVTRMLKAFALPQGASDSDLLEALGKVEVKRFWLMGGGALKTAPATNGRRSMGVTEAVSKTLARLAKDRRVVLCDEKGREIFDADLPDGGVLDVAAATGSVKLAAMSDPEAVGLPPGFVLPLAARGVQSFASVAPDGSAMTLTAPPAGWPKNLPFLVHAVVAHVAALSQEKIDAGDATVDELDAVLLSRAWHEVAIATGGGFAIEKAGKGKPPWLQDEPAPGDDDEEEDDDEDEGKPKPKPKPKPFGGAKPKPGADDEDEDYEDDEDDDEEDDED